MAVATIQQGMTITIEKPAAPTPLSWLQMFMLPVLIALNPGQRAALQLRAGLYRRAAETKRREREIARELIKEARIYEQIIVTRWASLGEYHRPRSFTDGPEHRQPKLKTQYVKFEHIFTGSDSIYYKLLTRKRAGIGGLFGASNALPHNVRVIDLISEDTLNELSYACHRKVRAISEDPRLGTWVVVDRLQGMDGLPNRVEFHKMIEYYPVEDIENAPIIFGVGQHMRVKHASLSMFPHILVGGSTGSGKSNMINNIICQLIRFSDPDKLKIVLIDLKRMEFAYYRDLPHLHGNIIFTPEDALITLKELIKEATDRAELLAGKAKDIRAWNVRYPKEFKPRIICIIDEFAELVLIQDKKLATEITELVTRATNIGRAVGINIIVCTQRPAASTVPNSIKGNMPIIVGGRTQNGDQSRVIVGDSSLSGIPIDPPGRMLLVAGVDRGELRTPYVDDEDVFASVRIAKGRAAKVITLAGYDPVIEPDKLTGWLMTNCEGWLTGKVAHQARELGINKAMFAGYCQDQVNAGLAAKVGNTWRLKTAIKAPQSEQSSTPIPADPAVELATAAAIKLQEIRRAKGDIE